MEKNSHNFSLEKAKELANSEAGKQLFTYLQQENGEFLQNAFSLAAKGEYESLKQALSQALKSEEAQALIKKLEG